VKREERAKAKGESYNCWLWAVGGRRFRPRPLKALASPAVSVSRDEFRSRPPCQQAHGDSRREAIGAQAGAPTAPSRAACLCGIINVRTEGRGDGVGEGVGGWVGPAETACCGWQRRNAGGRWEGI
jgi:hypothetical protein